MMDWVELLNSGRRKDKAKRKEPGEGKSGVQVEARTEIERDYDRILFSAPVRRLADKTQVFPLERNDSVRNRLTHSHEVSNLARSLGVSMAFDSRIIAKGINAQRDVPSLLAAIGLAHDLGNPPFGHQGEYAIQSWFADNQERWVSAELTEPMKQDFLKFEGNAQTIRLLTRLQLINDDFGLNLTYATLAALMKYPTASDGVPDKKEDRHVANKKHGFFQSERSIVEEIWGETGLGDGVRHPLTFLMEASDDIAYSVLDAEDAVKKGLVSFSDLMSYLEHHENGDSAIQAVKGKSFKKHAEYRRQSLSPAELNEISMQRFRVYAIGQMISDVRAAYIERIDEIMDGSLKVDLLEASESNRLCGILKKFDKAHAYAHRGVLEVELTGYNTIRGLMDYFWTAITERTKPDELGSKRKTPFSAYAYNRISENYRRVFESNGNDMPIRYRELQLLTDMISGMTDSYAISIYGELKQFHVS